jgi:tetratricopeptide (TPR) repeat protein
MQLEVFYQRRRVNIEQRSDYGMAKDRHDQKYSGHQTSRLYHAPSLFILIAGMALLLACGALAAPVEESFSLGRKLYDEGNFSAAIDAFKGSVESQPESAEYSLWLARAYGRLAERSNWFLAIKLALKTRRYLERAVELEPNNTDALADMIEYYTRAPGFLGGDTDKAARLQKRLDRLQ